MSTYTLTAEGDPPSGEVEVFELRDRDDFEAARAAVLWRRANPDDWHGQMHMLRDRGIIPTSMPPT